MSSPSNLTATLTINPNNTREACLEITGHDTFIGRRITLSRMFGGTFAPDRKIRAGLMALARQEGRLALGNACPVIKWA